MMSKPEPDGIQIPLAEYSALRAEIDQRAGIQWLALLASVGYGVNLLATADRPRWWVAAGYPAACLLDATLIVLLNRSFNGSG
jgi:hypothetical protein